MLWTVVYSDSLGGAQTDTDLPVIVADQSITTDGASHPLLPVSLLIMWSYYMSATGTRARISTPKFKPIARPLIKPIEAAAAPSSRPQICENWSMPIRVNRVEPVQIIRTYTAAGERSSAVLTFGDNNRNIPQGDEYCMRLTSAFTPTNVVWTASGVLTFDDTLMAGEYSIIGLESACATGLAARLIFPGPPLKGMIAQIRPGVIQSPALTSQGTRYFRHGFLGEFGRFESFAPPQIEAFEITGVANPETYLDVIQTRTGFN